MAEAEAIDEVPATGGKSSRSFLIIAIVAILAISGGATYYLTHAKGGGEEIAAEEHAEGEEAAEPEVPVTPYYFSLNPPFVVNFVGKGRAKFLQVNIDGLTRDPGVKEDITTHLPRIRNSIVFILSSQRYEDLSTPEGKENLRKQILEEVRSILKKETGNGDVEDIYFTSFVMQ